MITENVSHSSSITALFFFFVPLCCRRPTVLAYLGLCTAPCFAIIIAGSKVLPLRLIDAVSERHLLMYYHVVLQQSP